MGALKDVGSDGIALVGVRGPNEHKSHPRVNEVEPMRRVEQFDQALLDDQSAHDEADDVIVFDTPFVTQ